MAINELKVEEIGTVEEVKRYYKMAADELVTAEEDMLFDEDGFNEASVEHVRQLRKLVYALRSRVYELETPSYSDEVVDLYLDRSNHYTICEHDKSEPIGIIDIQEGDTLEKNTASIRCSMKKEYRGNSFALRAMRLVGEELLQRGIVNITVQTNDKDMPDIDEFAGMSLQERATYQKQMIAQNSRHSSR